MNMNIENDAQFLASLGRAQKRYFLARERERQALLQAALRDLSRGFGAVGALNGEAQALLLDCAGEG
jgi:hypothetical protein